MELKEKILARGRELAEELSISSDALAALAKNLEFSYDAGEIDKEKAVSSIDHTILSFNATKSDVLRVCREAMDYKFKAVCVNPFWVKSAAEFKRERGGRFLIAAVVDFPLGASSLAARISETERALRDGADEIDLVISVGTLKSKMFKETFDLTREPIKTGGRFKAILETSALTEDEKIDAALLAFFAGAKMLKTSTGVNGRATVEDVKLLRMIAGNELGVKAAGGIRTKETLIEMMRAGADRIGCSSSVSIAEGWR